jgi:hypothetical protein
VTVDTVFKKLGHKISGYLPHLLHVLLCMAAETKNLLQRRHLLAAKFINQLKNIRQTTQTRIVQVRDRGSRW